MEDLECGRQTVSKEEYLELLQRVHMLENLNRCSVKKSRGFMDLVTEKSLSLPRNLVNDKPVFGFTSFSDQDISKLFVAIGKSIHDRNGIFYMSTSYPGNTSPYIRQTETTKIRLISELTEEQIQLSVEMLDEMIKIYNRYMIKCHPYVEYQESPRENAKKYAVNSANPYAPLED